MKYVLFLAAAFASLTVVAGNNPVIKSARLDKSQSTITYHMNHPMHSWDGVSKAVDGIVQYDEKSLQISKVAIAVKVSSFDSDNSNRDSHMMEVTEAIKYPNVTFVSTAITDNGSILDITGTLSFHGVSKSIHFTATKTRSGNRISVTGNFIILIEEYNLERPSLMMVKTDNEVGMKFTAVFDLVP